MNEKKPLILLVDDTPANLDVLRAILQDRYALKVALSGEKALALMALDPMPDLVLLDVMMPGMDGFEVCKRLKSSERTRRVPVVFVTALTEVEDETRGFDAGGVDYITKPVSPPVVQARVATHLSLYSQEQHLNALVERRTEQLQKTRLEVIRRLGRAAGYKDDEAGLHVVRVSHMARLLAKSAGLPDADVDVIYHAAPLHDVGKIGLPDELRSEDVVFSDAQRKLHRQHPLIAARIIGKHDDPLLETARVIALTHHEHWDGSGFPRGLKGEQIPLAGRIVAIASHFDRLTGERTGYLPISVEAAVLKLRDDQGRRFDPQLVQHFVAALSEVQRILDQYSDIPVSPFD